MSAGAVHRCLTVLAIAVSTAVAATSCTAPNQPDPTEEKSLTRTLTDGGVGVIDEWNRDDLDLTGNTVNATTEQVEAMENQIASGGGYTGYELDELTLLTSELPPVSYLLAGWARDHDGAGAEAARSILGEQEWTQPTRIIWPDAVLALYLADVTADLDAADRVLPVRHLHETPATSAVPAGVVQGGVGALCAGGARFVQQALATVFAALDAASAAAQRAIGGIFGTIVGLGIDLFRQAVSGAVGVAESVTAALIAPIKEALTVVAVLQTLSSTLRPWGVTMRADPSAIEMQAAPQTGRVETSVSGQGLGDYPDWLRECSTALGLRLPEPPGEGAAITWDVQSWPAGVTLAAADPRVGAGNTARMSYQVPAEPAEDRGGIPVPGVIEVRLTPSRTEVDALNAMADQLINSALASVPTVVRSYVAGVVSSLRAHAVAKLKALLTPSSTSVIAIPMTFHLPKKDPPDEPVRPRPAVDPNEAFCRAWAAHVAQRLAELDTAAPETVQDWIALAEEWAPGGPAIMEQLIALAPETPKGYLTAARDANDKAAVAATPAELLPLMKTFEDNFVSAVVWAANTCPDPYRGVFARYRDLWTG